MFRNEKKSMLLTLDRYDLLHLVNPFLTLSQCQVLRSTCRELSCNIRVPLRRVHLLQIPSILAAFVPFKHLVVSDAKTLAHLSDLLQSYPLQRQNLTQSLYIIEGKSQHIHRIIYNSSHIMTTCIVPSVDFTFPHLPRLKLLRELRERHQPSSSTIFHQPQITIVHTNMLSHSINSSTLTALTLTYVDASTAQYLATSGLPCLKRLDISSITRDGLHILSTGFQHTTLTSLELTSYSVPSADLIHAWIKSMPQLQQLSLTLNEESSVFMTLVQNDPVACNLREFALNHVEDSIHGDIQSVWPNLNMCTFLAFCYNNLVPFFQVAISTRHLCLQGYWALERMPIQQHVENVSFEVCHGDLEECVFDVLELLSSECFPNILTCTLRVIPTCHYDDDDIEVTNILKPSVRCLLSAIELCRRLHTLELPIDLSSEEIDVIHKRFPHLHVVCTPIFFNTEN